MVGGGVGWWWREWGRGEIPTLPFSNAIKKKAFKDCDVLDQVKCIKHYFLQYCRIHLCNIHLTGAVGRGLKFVRGPRRGACSKIILKKRKKEKKKPSQM